MTIPQAEESEELLTSEQIIRWLHANATLRRAAVTCVLPAVRYGDEWRFRRRDLETWIARQIES
jgi:hypothetical protein